MVMVVVAEWYGGLCGRRQDARSGWYTRSAFFEASRGLAGQNVFASVQCGGTPGTPGKAGGFASLPYMPRLPALPPGHGTLHAMLRSLSHSNRRCACSLGRTAPCPPSPTAAQLSSANGKQMANIVSTSSSSTVSSTSGGGGSSNKWKGLLG